MRKKTHVIPVFIRRITGRNYSYRRLKLFIENSLWPAYVVLQVMAELHAVRGKESRAVLRLREAFIADYGDDMRTILGMEYVVWKEEKIKVDRPREFVMWIARLRNEGFIMGYSSLELARKMLEIFDLPYTIRSLRNLLDENK